MPRPPASPLPEDERPSESLQIGQPSKDHSKSRSSKHMKKLKKHAKHETIEGEVAIVEIGTKPKRHKKSGTEKISSVATYPPSDQMVCDLVPGSKRTEPEVAPSGESEPVKKKKKRSKDHQSKLEKVKNKKGVVSTAISVTSEETCSAETSLKPRISSRSKDRSKTTKESDNLLPSSSSNHQSYMSSIDRERRDHHATPVLSDVTARHTSPEPEPEPVHYGSSRRSSHSSRFSSARSSSYSRSPSHRVSERRSDPWFYREQYRDRGSRYRVPERSRSPDPRHFQPRRTYVAYRPPSAGRDSSYEDYVHESRTQRSRRSRSRSHGMSKPSYDSRDSAVTQSSTRLRDPSPRRTYSRRPYRDEPDRSPRRSGKRDRHVDERHARHDPSTSDERRIRSYRMCERENFTNADHADSSVQESRRDTSRERARRDPMRYADTEHRMPRSDKQRTSPSRSSAHHSRRTEQGFREDKGERQRDSESTKRDRPTRRQNGREDRKSTDHATPTEPSTTSTGNIRSRPKRSTTPKSPRTTKKDLRTRKSHSSSSSTASSKLRPMHEHLDQLHFEAVSDTELESMLAPAVFRQCITTKDAISAGTFDSSGDHQLTDSGPTPTRDDPSAVSTSDITIDSSGKSGTKGEEQTALVLDTLDKISLQLRQKMARPETWETGTSSDSDAEDETALSGLDELFTDHSVVGLTACKPSLSARSRPLIASLMTPWQRLVESASKTMELSEVAPEQTASEDKEYIQPAVCVGSPLGPRLTTFPCRLVPFQRRASGASCLARIGVSAHYLGSERVAELNRLIREQLTTTDTKTSDSVFPASDNVGAEPIAWMRRTQDIISPGHELPRLWFDCCAPFGVLTGVSDHAMRRFLLQKVN